MWPKNMGKKSFLNLFNPERKRLTFVIYVHQKKKNPLKWDFPGSPVVRTLPSNAGDAGLIPCW